MLKWLKGSGQNVKDGTLNVLNSVEYSHIVHIEHDIAVLCIVR